MTDTETDKGQKPDWKLKAAGTSYIVGDASLMAAGHLRGETGLFRGSAIWMAGGVGAAIFGNPDVKKQTEITASKLEDYLKKKGIAIPADARGKNELLKEKSFWDHITQFCYEHPSELLNAAYAIGSCFLLKGGYDKIKAGDRTWIPKNFTLDGIGKMSSTFWMGALILPGALIGMFAKEDPKAKEKAKDGNFIDKAIAFVTEKPLRISGAFYGLNNFFLAHSVLTDFRDATKTAKYAGKSLKPHIFSGLTLACYVFSNVMLALSPRDQITGSGYDKETIAKLEDAAARVIASLPAEQQKQLLTDVSQFMSQQKGVNVDAATLAKDMAERIGQLTGQQLQDAASNVKWTKREHTREQTPSSAQLS